MLKELQSFAMQRYFTTRLSKHPFQIAMNGPCRTQNCVLLRCPTRFKHKNSVQNQKLIGQGATNKQWAVYFAGFSVAVVIATYIRKERDKRLHKEIFEERIETCTDKDMPYPGAIIYGGFILPSFTKGCIQDIKNFSLRDEDILVVSFPKSGTTWMQEIVYLIKEGVASEAASNVEERFPYLEYVYPGIKDISKREGPRLIKSHLPYPLLPDDVRINKGKVIYVVRNPKDVIVSYYHFARMLSEVNYRGTFKEFFDQFINNKVPYGPWWNHVASFFLHRNDENLLIVSYEEMHKDPVKVVGKVAEFLGKTLSDQEKLILVAKTSFTNMATTNYSWWDEIGLRNQEEANFFRKGMVGDWQNYMDAEMSGKVEETVQRYLQPLGCQFTYKIDKS